MKKHGWLFMALLIMETQSISAWSELTAQRMLSLTGNWPDDLTVKVTITITGEAGPVLMRETFPAGWTASSIRLGGQLQDNTILWDRSLAFSNSILQLSYNLKLSSLDIAPGLFTGTVNEKNILGVVSFDPKKVNSGVQTPMRNGLKYNYLVYLPQVYEASSQPWPLLLFLHGAGERGADLSMVKTHGPPKIVENFKSMQSLFQGDSPFVVVSPQCPSNQNWDIPALHAVLRQVQQDFHIDSDRIYVTGLSMGGYGTWAFGGQYPDEVAAIVPICGFGPANVAGLAKVPIWAFHGGNDSVVPVSASQTLYNQVKALGGDAQLTIYPGVDHDSWTQTYNNPDVFRWILSHTKNPTSVEDWPFFQ